MASYFPAGPDNLANDKVDKGLRTIGVGNILVTGGPLPGTACTLTFAGTLATGPQPPFSGQLKVGNATPTYTTVTRGSWAEINNSYEIWLQSSVTGETFSVTGKSTGGFTITSSNAASTARVNWLLVR